jgi:hypothetical protein
MSKLKEEFMKNIKDALIMDAIAFVQDDEKTMVLVMGDIVTIKTDGTKFK